MPAFADLPRNGLLLRAASSDNKEMGSGMAVRRHLERLDEQLVALERSEPSHNSEHWPRGGNTGALSGFGSFRRGGRPETTGVHAIDNDAKASPGKKMV